MLNPHFGFALFALLFALMQKVTKKSRQSRRQLPPGAQGNFGFLYFEGRYRRWHRSSFRLQALFPGRC
jgi:hypothetical protein